MKVHSIITEQEATAKTVANMFDKETWYNIFAHYSATANGGNYANPGISLGNDKNTIIKRLETIDKSIGSQMDQYNNNYDWLHTATRYGLTKGLSTEAGWNEIANHLRKGTVGDYKKLKGFDVESTPLVAPNANPNTPETRAKFIELVKDSGQIADSGITDQAILIDRWKYFCLQWIPTLRDEEWSRKLACVPTGTSGSANIIKLAKRMRRKYLDPKRAQQGSVSTEDFAKVLYEWLINADMLFAKDNYCPKQDD